MVFQQVQDIFFSEKFWLPPNVTWADFEDENYNMPKIRDLWLAIPLTFVVLLFRYIFERTVAYPLGRLHGLSEKPARQPEKNEILEKYFKKNGRIIPGQDQLVILSKDTDMPIRQIERWWRLKRGVGKPTEMHRLAESCFRCVMYFILFAMGLYNLWGEPYFLDTKECWTNFPKQNVTESHRWYWCMEIAFYLSLLMSAGNDSKQKDFLEMMVHHVTSLLMFYISWLGNFVRVSVLVVAIHDCADPLLDAAKVAKYLKYKTLPDIIFIFFTIMWILSRLVALPWWAGYTSLFEGHKIIGASFPAYWMLFSLYGLLQVLHFYWFTFIAKVIYHYIILKKAVHDTRDTTDSESEEEETETKSRTSQSNGHHNHTDLNGHGTKVHNNNTNGSIK